VRLLRASAIYAVAAIVYITVGVFFTDFMLSVFVAIGYLLVAAWIVPAAMRRFL
jgi:hypothetical protein